MAFGGRQSSSTLSPHAPPFTVDRKPYDYAHEHTHRDWRLPRSDLAQAEPFYPHYASRGGRAAPWNGPFDEGCGGSNTSSSSLSTWTGTGRGGKADAPWIGPTVSAPPLQGDFADTSTVENIWGSNHVDPYARNHTESYYQGWLPNKTSVSTPDSDLKANNFLGSGFPPLELTCDAFPYSSSEVASRGLYDTSNSSSHRYFGPVVQNESWREEVNVCGSTAYCPPVHLPETFGMSNYFSEKSSIGKVEKLAHGRRSVSVNISMPRSSNSEAVDSSAKSNKKGENIASTDVMPLHLDEEHPLPGHASWIEESQEKIHAESGLSNTCLAASSSVEPSISNKKLETDDQHNLAEDSPCWKGALASRQSPFHGVNTFAANSPTFNKIIEDDAVKVLESSTINDSNLNSLSGPSERKKEYSLLEDTVSGSQMEGCVDMLLTKRDISSSAAHCLSTDEIASSNPVSRPAITNASCYSSSHVYSSSWDSYLNGASDIVKPIGPPESFDLNQTKSMNDHFLFRTLCDLSAFCASYSVNDNMLSESDYELLLMTRYNVEACLSKRNSVEDKTECHHGPEQVKVVRIKGTDSLYQSNNGAMSEKMLPLRSGISCDESGALHPIISSVSFTGSDLSKDFEKSLREKFNGEVVDRGANLYKKLWIEAEAALCKMKYELHLAQGKAGNQSIQQKATQDMQDISSVEADPEKKTSVHSITSEFSLEKENDVKSVPIESLSCSDLNIVAGASSREPEDVVGSGLMISKEEIDPPVMARFKVLMARANKVTPSNIDPPDQLHHSVAADQCIGVRLTSSKISCSSNEFGTGACFQTSSTGPVNGGNLPWVSNMGINEAGHMEATTESGDSRLMASFEGQIPLYEIDGHTARSHESLGSRKVMESYVSNNGWQGNRFLDGKQGSSSSDWEHVLQEDVAW